jgi:hypothetical protein
MAYVAISFDLRESVRRNIDAMKRRELNAAAPKEKTEAVRLHQVTQHHLEIVLGEHLHLKPIIPQKWYRKVQNVYLRAERKIGDTDVSATLTYEFPDTIPAPPGSEHYIRKDVGEEFPGMKELLDAAVNRREIELRWNKVHDQVTTFIKNCKSLNEALKLWPDVKLYIPQNYLDRVEQKTNKPKESRAAEVLKQIDTDTATASVVGLRFVEALKEQQ